MTFYILAPAEVVSGGPELAHQMCAELNSNHQNAFMYYIYANHFGPADVECAEKFKKYNTAHITSHEEADKEENVIIVPEGIAGGISWFRNAKVVLWWMSVDNYYKAIPCPDICLLDEQVSLHLTQSEYAHDFLIRNNIEPRRIITVSDYISELYGQFMLPAEYRKNIALYNPKKGYNELRPVIEASPFMEWRPLVNLSEEEMIVLMQIAKVYVDFGNHPGKDRIPREAALCGCCVITNRRGSAAFYEDVPIPEDYKINTDDAGYVTGTSALIRDIADNYPNFFRQYDAYRAMIKQEKHKFSEDVKGFIAKIKSYA